MTRSKQGLPILIKSEPHKDDSDKSLHPQVTYSLLKHKLCSGLYPKSI